MKQAIVAAALISLASFAGCGNDMPSILDGNGTIILAITDTSGFFPGSEPGVPFCLDSTEVSIQARSHEFTATCITNINGIVVFEGLVAGEYSLFARRQAFAGSGRRIFTGFSDITISSDHEVTDTIHVQSILGSDLMINEIFYCGSDASSYYWFDQFVELCNASDDTLYLDGIILTRQRQTIDPDMENKDYVEAIYAYQFPGSPVTGRDHPILPGQIIVIAADAVDHSQWCPKSIDLSGADWECFNPLGSDYDVLDVPNLVNINPSSRVDYMINLSHNSIVIATGEEYWFDAESHILIPISTVIDGVEYAKDSSSDKQLTTRIDAGFAGLGNTKYSGQSTERREFGLDTNHSTFDFVLNSRPTPGYSHVE